MPEEKAKPTVRRSQAERREQTQQKILNSATKLFGDQGFSATAIEDIARDAGMTEGPVYHYFGNKKTLFCAVTEQMEARLSVAISNLSVDLTDGSILQVWDAFVQICQQPGFVQIVLIDAPHILGRERWPHTTVTDQVQKLLHQSALLDAAQLSDDDKALFIRMLTAAMAEAALMIAEQPDYDARSLLGKIAAMLP